MAMRYVVFGMLMAVAAAPLAAERFLMNFELIQGENKVEWGRTFVSHKPYTWSKGLRRSYLRLRCKADASGKVQKLYSTVDHFAGLRITHKLIGERVEVTVIRDVVQSRLAEIRAVPKGACKELAPIVTTTTETYAFPAQDESSVSQPFGEAMAFKARLQSIGGGS